MTWAVVVLQKAWTDLGKNDKLCRRFIEVGRRVDESKAQIAMNRSRRGEVESALRRLGAPHPAPAESPKNE